MTTNEDMPDTNTQGVTLDEKAVAAAKKEIALAIQFKDFGHKDENGDWRVKGYQIDDFDAACEAAACNAIRAYLSAAQPEDKWAIDRSTDSPILTYEKCSVIQDEQAFYVLGLIRAAQEGREAVAWQVRQFMSELDPPRWGTWTTYTEKPSWGTGGDVEYRPLYPSPPSPEPDAELVEAFKDVLSSLVAAHSLLSRSPKTAAPSNKMFDQMLKDYAASIKRGRAILARHRKQGGA